MEVDGSGQNACNLNLILVHQPGPTAEVEGQDQTVEVACTAGNALLPETEVIRHDQIQGQEVI